MPDCTFRFSSPETEKEEDVETLDERGGVYEIILWNDDVNTFEWVIECLVKYCGHAIEQAEQCAYIVHFNGKCSVKKGEKKKLEKILKQLTAASLTATMNQL